MNTQEFLELLAEHSEKRLNFEYAPGHFIGKGFHITEIKNNTIEAVDCGGRADSWCETIIQLWEDSGKAQPQENMTAYKALSILKKVDAIRKMNRDAVIRFEYGNANLPMAQFFVIDVHWNQRELVVKLASGKTDCKAREACGLTPVVADESEACTPGSGCC